MRYESPATTKEACALLAKEKGAAFVLAGSIQGAVGSILLQLILGKIEVPDAVKEEIAIVSMSAPSGLTKMVSTTGSTG